AAGFWLKFTNDGWFTAQTCNPGAAWLSGYDSHNQPVYQASTLDGKNAPVCSGPINSYRVPDNGAIYVAPTSIVSNAPTNPGVEGRVTVAANNNIVIGGDINPVTSGTDVLGLVAGNEMIIPYWVPQNLTWTAATISENGQWRSWNNECQGYTTSPPCAH